MCGWSEAFGGEADSLNRRATYLDGKVGSHVVLNCPLDFPQDDPIPYVLRWFKDVSFFVVGWLVCKRISAETMCCVSMQGERNGMNE